jgi:hypothetical protein
VGVCEGEPPTVAAYAGCPASVVSARCSATTPDVAC